MSAAVDRRVARRVEVDEVDEQLATFNADETVPVPCDVVTAVSRAYCQLAVVDALAALTNTAAMHSLIQTRIHFVYMPTRYSIHGRLY